MNKLSVCVLLICFFSSSALAQAPDSLAYQGYVTDTGTPINGTADLTFRILRPDATLVWSEVQTGVPVDHGIYNVYLGSVVPLSGVAFDRPLDLQVLVNGEEQNPVTPFASVPYALSLRSIRITPPDESFNGPNIIGGHISNTVEAGVVGATISGGGKDGFLQPDWHIVSGNYGFVGGGAHNRAGRYAAISGGRGNIAEGEGAHIGGGVGNEAGGGNSAIGGGWYNSAGGFESTIGGGVSNDASGSYSTIGGGSDNDALGSYSFAAGRQAKVRATDHGTFAWADHTNADFESSGEDQFLVRANGGIKMVRGNGPFTGTNAALQVEQTHTGGEAAWFKQTVDASAPVASLVKLPTSTNDFLAGYAQDVTTVRKFHINSAGTWVGGSDFAEAMPLAGTAEEPEPGDVLVISRSHPGAVEQSSKPHDSAVIGVYSTRPGILGADKDGVTEVGEDDIPVAIAGIVPVKVSAENGPIYPGDLLTTSTTRGHAMLAEPVTIDGVSFFPSGVVIGKALGPLQKGTGVIKMFVMCQ